MGLGSSSPNPNPNSCPNPNPNPNQVFFGYHRAPAGSPAHRPIPANFGRIGLPFNVFEAVLQDAAVYRLGLG